MLNKWQKLTNKMTFVRQTFEIESQVKKIKLKTYLLLHSPLLVHNLIFSSSVTYYNKYAH